MAKRYLVILIISVLYALKCNSQVISTDDRLRRTVVQFGQAEVTISSSDVISFDYLTRNVSILSVRDKLVHVSLSVQNVEWFILQKFHYQIVERKVSKEIVSTSGVTQAMDWASYPTWAQYDSIMQTFPVLYPSLCKLDTIGTSINGKLVLALRISGNNNKKPAVFYSSTMHGDETGGFILMLHLADYILKNYPGNSRVKTLVDSLEIWINPLANPDGTYWGGNTISSPIRYNANGYDLNRNFPDPFTPNTVMQKETLDMISFMRKHKFVLSANFHSGTEVVNYPWDRWLSRLHADDVWFNSISRAYADTAHVYGGPQYMNFLNNGVTRGALWYIVYGGRQDFMTWELHGREVTIEVDDQYITPAAQLLLLWQNNMHSLLGYLENALYGIHGIVHNANSHVPVAAKVFITNHDVDSSQVYSDSISGGFIRFLAPGSWNLTFTAPGYKPLIMNDINVIPGRETSLIANMLPVVNGIENPGSSSSVVLYPNPAKDEIRAMLPDTLQGRITIRIFGQTGTKIREYDSESVQGLPLTIDTRRFASGIYSVIFKNTVTQKYSRGRFIIIR